jgi:cytochrome c-type protein NapB
LKFNKCLTCHSWANYKDAGATKIPPTHFRDRDGNDLSNVSARRYVCTQCHVPQAEAQPLVENEFKPVRAITGK